MTDTEILDDETELARTEQVALSVFTSSDPRIQLDEAKARAAVLAEFIQEQGLSKRLGRGSKPHVFVEGWTFLGMMVGVHPEIEWTRELRDDDGNVLGWEARCVARDGSGKVVGSGEMECRFSEKNWRDRDSYAVRSMAQTRATSKAMRLPLSSLMVLAGYSQTPAEEMDGVPQGRQPRAVHKVLDGESKEHAKRAVEEISAILGGLDAKEAGELFKQGLIGALVEGDIDLERFGFDLGTIEDSELRSIAARLTHEEADIAIGYAVSGGDDEGNGSP